MLYITSLCVLLASLACQNHAPLFCDYRAVLSSESVSPDIVVDRYCPVPALIKTVQHGLFQFTEELLKRGATVR